MNKNRAARQETELAARLVQAVQVVTRDYNDFAGEYTSKQVTADVRGLSSTAFQDVLYSASDEWAYLAVRCASETELAS